MPMTPNSGGIAGTLYEKLGCDEGVQIFVEKVF
jgi:hypothetical protein